MSLNCSFFFSAEKLPVDEVNGNFVRTVKNCIFSKSTPTPLRGPLRLAALSKVESWRWTELVHFYDRRSIWNVTYSTGCGWGYPERGRECSPDGWLPAVRQRWQGAARICSACTQIRRSSGTVCDHIWPSIRHKKMNSRELSNILVWTFVSFELVWLLGRSAWWWPRTFAWSVYRQVSLFLCNVTYITNSQFKGHFTKKR